MGIEPISSVWKTEVIATIPYPHFQLRTNPIGTTCHQTLSVQLWISLKAFLKAAPRIELGIKDLQSSALPLGHATISPETHGTKPEASLLLTRNSDTCSLDKRVCCISRLSARSGRVEHLDFRSWSQKMGWSGPPPYFCLQLAQTGFEPVTLGLWVPCSTTKLLSLLNRIVPKI